MEQPGAAVVVTGFGPFGEHPVNASWVAVQELQRLGLGDGVELHVYEIPVEYQAVQRLVPELWERHNPRLVVHVGVSGAASTVTLETCGHNAGYCRPDNLAFCPPLRCCVAGGPDFLCSALDMGVLCRRLEARGLDVALTTSQDAGRFLCDFAYYQSLLRGSGRAAFVHVPPLGSPYSAGQLGRALRALVLEMLALLDAPSPHSPARDPNSNQPSGKERGPTPAGTLGSAGLAGPGAALPPEPEGSCVALAAAQASGTRGAGAESAPPDSVPILPPAVWQ